jgi:threonine dehydrogenase-like Zn-dependent dehydrogenase
MMRALTWHGKRDVRVEEVPDPKIEEPTDAISIGQPITERFGVDRLRALTDSIATVRRGGTLSIVGVYGGAIDPLPMMEMFDKGIQLRMGQCHVKRWIGDILPLVVDDGDPLGTETLATQHLPLEQAPHGYDIFQKKAEGCVKVLLQPERMPSEARHG